jgi:NADPH:quinone reductase-like Zn-dependent oxidoreductase
MKAIVVADQAAGTAGMKLVERPEPQPSINDVVVQVHAAGFTWDRHCLDPRRCRRRL